MLYNDNDFEKNNGLNNVTLVIFALIISLLLHFTFMYYFSGKKIELFKDFPASTNRLDFTSISIEVDEYDEAKVEEILNNIIPIEENDKVAIDNSDKDLKEGEFIPQNIDGGILPSSKNPIADFNETVQSEDIGEWMPRIEIVQIERDLSNINNSEIKHFVIPDIQRFDSAPDFALPINKIDVKDMVFSDKITIKPMTSGDDEISLSSENVVGTNIENIEEKITEEIVTEISSEVVDIPNEEPPPIPIENVLNTKVFVYAPPISDGYKYFRIDVERKSEDILPVINKDVLFIQDASRSVSEMRIGILRKTLLDAIDKLSPNDRYNILAFNSENKLCFGKTWQEASRASGKVIATEFVNSLKPDGNTDIYKAMEKIMEMPSDPNRVIIAILISDGLSTSGLTQDTKIISNFSMRNKGDISVFTVGLSNKSNNYLLSMLSALNRGSLARLPKDKFSINDEALSLFKDISRPVLSDISFIFDSASGADVVPRKTTHLYLDMPFSLYGRIEEDKSNLIFQAIGKSGQKKHDMIFEVELKNTDVISGDESIRNNWARAKMFDCFAEYDKTLDDSLRYEMFKIEETYKVPIPFKR